MTLGEKIKFLRKQFNITQQDFADKLYISRQAVQKWEADLSTPDIERIKEIASIFNISIDHLLNDDLNLQELLTILTKKKEKNVPEVKQTKQRSAIDYLVIIPGYVGLFTVIGILYMMLYIGLITLGFITLAMPIYGIFSIINVFFLNELGQILIGISFVLVGLGSFYPLFILFGKYYAFTKKALIFLNKKTKKYWEVIKSCLRKF